MAKKGSRGRRTRKMMNNQQGGNAPDSAWGYVMNTVGDGWTQFMDTFSVSPDMNAGTLNSNQLVSIKNPNINNPNTSTLKQTGGKRRKGKGKKGGFLGVGAVLEQAVVPFGLLALQQSYGKSRRAKRGGSKRSRRHH
jgi:hypothetical protein